MKRLILTAIIIVFLAPCALCKDVHWWDRTPEGKALLQKELKEASERIDRRNKERREEERHQEQMKKLKEIEDDLYWIRLEDSD